jgi:hypothetical protein
MDGMKHHFDPMNTKPAADQQLLNVRKSNHVTFEKWHAVESNQNQKLAADSENEKVWNDCEL